MWYEESPSEGGDCETLVVNEQKSALTSVTSPAVTAMSVSSLVSTPANRLDLPHNFYWAIPGKLIGMGCPTKKKHIENLVEHYKVSVVVNLRECRTGQQLFEGLPVNNVHFPIKSFDVPTMEQAQQFICCVDEVLEPDPPKDKDKEEEEEFDAPSECGHANKSENNERKDYRNGTQASNIDAGRCNDCFSDNSKPRWKKMKRNRHGMSMTEFVCDMEKNGNGGTLEGIVIRSNKKKKKNKPSEEDNNKRTKPMLATMRAVAVNCRWGKGRTGTMICCYLVHKEGITAHEAICRVRALSPCSIETKGQEEFVEEFYRLKMVAAGREADYTRSLPYPYTPQHHNYRTNNVPVVSVANATYGPASRGCAQRMASVNNKVCFNNPLLLAKMYK